MEKGGVSFQGPTYSSGHLNGQTAAWAWIDLQELTLKERCVFDCYDLTTIMDFDV